MIDKCLNAAEAGEIDDRNSRTQTYFSPNDEHRRSTKIALVKKADPFYKKWADHVPLTFKEKAVWEYDPRSGQYIPYRWENLKLNPKLNPNDVKNLLHSLKTQVPPPPTPIYCPVMVLYFLFVHCPIVYFLTKYFYENLDEDHSNDQVTWVSTKFVTAVVTLTVLMIAVYFFWRFRHKKSLIERAEQIQGVLDHFNQQVFGSIGVRFCVGKLGSWIEAQLLDPNVYMVGQESKIIIESKKKKMRSHSNSLDDNLLPCSIESKSEITKSLLKEN